MKNLERVSRLLERLGVSFALIGGQAVGVRGHPRMTLDHDLLTTDPRVLQRVVWESLEAEGVTVGPRIGESDDPLAGVVHLNFPDGREIDVVVGKWKWEQGVIDRAELLDVGGVRVPVPLTADLILLKLSAGGVLDLQDVTALLAGSDRNRLIREIEERITSLPADVAATWERYKTL